MSDVGDGSVVAAPGVGPGTSGGSESGGGSGFWRDLQYLVEALVFLPLLGLDRLDGRLAEMCGSHLRIATRGWHGTA